MKKHLHFSPCNATSFIKRSFKCKITLDQIVAFDAATAMSRIVIVLNVISSTILKQADTFNECRSTVEGGNLTPSS